MIPPVMVKKDIDKRIKHDLLERVLCLLFYISGSSMAATQKSLSIAFKRKIYLYIYNRPPA